MYTDPRLQPTRSESGPDASARRSLRKQLLQYRQPSPSLPHFSHLPRSSNFQSNHPSSLQSPFDDNLGPKQPPFGSPLLPSLPPGSSSQDPPPDEYVMNPANYLYRRSADECFAGEDQDGEDSYTFGLWVRDPACPQQWYQRMVSPRARGRAQQQQPGPSLPPLKPTDYCHDQCEQLAKMHESVRLRRAKRHMHDKVPHYSKVPTGKEQKTRASPTVQAKPTSVDSPLRSSCSSRPTSGKPTQALTLPDKRLAQIKSVEDDVRTIAQEVVQFCGELSNKHYLRLEDQLTKALLRLDGIAAGDDDGVRSARRSAVHCVQRLIECMEKSSGRKRLTGED